ncbi:type II toxin-antitoxin system HicA family toxin [Haloechinothrix salitolerans]|uniref:Type II toxin-antitoxin system HicA family toxin n=2 Tax=Haloechinothrix salitolerans TaxID=926830 RepID=A0ABW2C6L5_9PSEU
MERALLRHGYRVKSDDGIHTKWRCPCGQHSTNLPRHQTISPGVVRSTIKRLSCLPEGWLQ